MLIGTYLNTILYGVLILQTLLYYQKFKRDALWIKLFVLYLFLVESVNTVVMIYMIYEPLVTNFGQSRTTTIFPRMLPTDPLLTILISTPIQIFIAWRIKIVSQMTWLAVVICGFAVCSLGIYLFLSLCHTYQITSFIGGGLWLTIRIIQIQRFNRKPELHTPALFWLLASALADVVITVSLVINLSRRRTGFSETDDVVNKIIRMTIQTGCVTTIFALLDIICFLASPHSAINFVWDFALSKLYTNALMSSLNARSMWGNLIIDGSTSRNDLQHKSGTIVSRACFSPSSMVISHDTERNSLGFDVEMAMKDLHS